MAAMALAVPGLQELVDEFVAVAHGDLAKVKMLLAGQSCLLNAEASWQETAIGAAAHCGRVDIAEFLLSVGAPMDICTAAMLGLRRRVERDLQRDPALAHARGAHDLPALFYPAIRGHLGVAELLHAHGADVNARGGAPLHGAAGFNQPELAEWLLCRGAHPDGGDSARTPLMVALERGHAAVAEVLRRHGAR